MGRYGNYLVLLICSLAILMSSCDMKPTQSAIDDAEEGIVSEEKKEAVLKMKNINAANIRESILNAQGENIKIADSKEKRNDINETSSHSEVSNTSTANNQTVDKATSSIVKHKDIDKTIYIGTTKEDLVEKVNGYGGFWDLGAISLYTYSESSIYLSNNKVIGWDIRGNNLKVNVGEKISSAPAFTLGSSEEDVIHAMGTPDGYGIPYNQDPFTCKYSMNTSGIFEWRYGGYSFITFSKDLRVIAWYSGGNTELKVFIGNMEPSAPSIKLGSSLQDIIRAYGTPAVLTTYMEHSKYKAASYKSCIFTLDKNDKVIGWTNMGSDKIDMGSKQASAPPIWVGSTMQEVISAMGTPDKIEYTFKWYYGSSYITFDNNWVVNNTCNTGNLIIK